MFHFIKNSIGVGEEQTSTLICTHIRVEIFFLKIFYWRHWRTNADKLAFDFGILGQFWNFLRNLIWYIFAECWTVFRRFRPVFFAKIKKFIYLSKKKRKIKKNYYVKAYNYLKTYSNTLEKYDACKLEVTTFLSI